MGRLDSAEQAGLQYKKKEKKDAPGGWDVFNSKALYNAYLKRAEKIPVDLEEYNTAKSTDPEFYRGADSLQYGKVSKWMAWLGAALSVCVACSTSRDFSVIAWKDDGACICREMAVINLCLACHCRLRRQSCLIRMWIAWLQSWQTGEQDGCLSPVGDVTGTCMLQGN